MAWLQKILQFFKSINYILILAWVLPVGILLTILYLNFLPFGYEKTLTINVGTEGDDQGEFYLEKRPNLGARQSIDGKNFRYLDGLTYAIYEPKVVLKDATIEATIEGEGVSFILPPDLENIKWDYDWDVKTITKDFEIQTTEKNIYKRFKNSEFQTITSSVQFKPTEEFAIEIEWLAGTTAKLLNGDISLVQNQTELILKYDKNEIRYPLPDFFMGKNQTILIGFDSKTMYLFIGEEQIAKKTSSLNIGGIDIINIIKDQDTTVLYLHQKIKPTVDIKDNCVYLDGNTRLVIPNTFDKFEEGPFAIYTEWIPEIATNSQQIVGHYNWEIMQNEKSVSFQVGRMDTSTGQFYKISYPLDEEFFNKKHNLLAIYNPISENNNNGYIELFVDDLFSGRAYFGNKIIWKSYGNQNLSLGWSIHNYKKNPYFQGDIYNIKMVSQILNSQSKIQNQFLFKNNIIKLPLWGAGNIELLKIQVKK